ncbi:hypothetical protein KKA69_06475 [Patescibacteria group bacterium]|nr:hypothetical protein [Patescibacteria group bacterium]
MINKIFKDFHLRNNSTLLYELIFPFTLLLILILLSAFKIHGSSIGMFNKYFYGQEYKDPNLLLNQPRGIRSDEWVVGTMHVIAQAQEDFPVENDLFIAGQNFGTVDVPIRHWVTLFKPQNWIFFILPLENAYAFNWWSSSFLLAVVVYYITLKFSKGNILLSIISAITIIFSPYFQWWSTIPSGLVAFGLLALIGIIRLLNAGKLVDYVVSSVVMVYSFVCFVLILYPPFQITLFWLLVFIFFGYFMSRAKRLPLSQIKKNIAIIVVGVFIPLGILYLYSLSFKDVISAITSTIYPGNRLSAGGGLSIFNTIGGMYNIQLLNDARPVPPMLGNQSEASSFFFLSVFLLPFYLYQLLDTILHKKSFDWIVFFGICYFLLMSAWGFGLLPMNIGNFLLLNRVPGTRVLLGLGVANHFGIFYYISQEKRIDESKTSKILILVFSLISAICIYLIGIDLSNSWPSFIGNRFKIFLLASAFGLLIYLLIRGKTVVFSFLFLFITLTSTFAVNPLYRGLSPILDSKLSSEISQIESSGIDGSWALYDNLILENYFAANGASAINGTYVAPNLEFWSKFDPKGEYQDIYNRYAHIILRSTSNEEEIRFELVQGDLFIVHINPCNEVLNKIGVSKFVFIEPQDFHCLNFENKVIYPQMPLYTYTIDQ